ncbi:flagellar biosynthetic protein FliQ [Elioraea rosea]|uniref:flagellar biosynthetic protein FliQ n=1 Tax=Elioraea rosea TaxID=2492390 RepID=UPI0011837F51|nr:flagellar biosynthetic protein FliQ [Elioraea rosea]
MTDQDVVALVREGLWVAIIAGGPLMVAALAVGLIVSLFQALTQINEASLVFVPKVIAVGAVAALSAPFIGGTIGAFAERLFDRIVAVGGGGF